MNAILDKREYVQASFVVQLLFLSYTPLQAMANDLRVSIGGGRCRCESRNVLPWSIYFYIRILVPMLCLKTIGI